ncbi:U-box domain-containing 62 [Olea europaea subsp. europaea]|uniref:U-box domain-containing 62 n=1 Tax=Olea europaea subsp. europaea TaxID=158383 RepID=A0A8S0PFQ2_OLEEU|nr:U-box domain-containing 62 [Olea europaea subsp. europaea]
MWEAKLEAANTVSYANWIEESALPKEIGRLLATRLGFLVVSVVIAGVGGAAIRKEGSDVVWGLSFDGFGIGAQNILLFKKNMPNQYYVTVKYHYRLTFLLVLLVGVNFIGEQRLQVNRASKKRKERYNLEDKGTCGDSELTEHSRGRGVQFPFAVADRVIIKGNKRTPQRFVGREAIVTTQCLNGWYVVKTLDNAESVKLQYRSLAKVQAVHLPTFAIKMLPNWL